MSLDVAFERLAAELTGSVRRAEPLARHTTYRIGGPAALFVECATVADLAAATTILGANNIEWTVLGKGSNVLASDEGYGGAIITLGRDFKRHSVDDDHLRAGAGVILAAVVQDAFKLGLSGLEFAVGVPGTLGGALAMNAGSRDEWIGSIVESVTVFSPGAGLVGIRGPEIAWAYRRSDLPARGIIVEAVLRVTESDAVGIRRSMEASLRRRKRSQPLNMPSAGSVFVNPEGDSAGRLIEKAGLKGTKVGGAMVSDVHANFIVNSGGATAADVVALVRLIRETVKEANGIELRPEIRFLGQFLES
ncbi:MAG: UDP-N-acetylmuramate dehydrogenase [Coriobacteriia bacterium]|nr:UDP-N-acetylmuramate dehydrogenase [Coriobacteriia bacterium]